MQEGGWGYAIKRERKRERGKKGGRNLKMCHTGVQGVCAEWRGDTHAVFGATHALIHKYYPVCVFILALSPHCRGERWWAGGGAAGCKEWRGRGKNARGEGKSGRFTKHGLLPVGAGNKGGLPREKEGE